MKEPDFWGIRLISFGEPADIAVTCGPAVTADATALVHPRSLVWFEGSVVVPQCVQSYRMHALEAGDFVLRAASPGITAISGLKVQYSIVCPSTGTLRSPRLKPT